MTEYKKLKILHAPVNIANIAPVLSKREKELCEESDCVFYYSHPFYDDGQCLDFEQCSRIGRVIRSFLFFIKSLFSYNTFHFYFGLSLLPFNMDLPIYRLLGKKVIMTYCGSDIRLVKHVEYSRNPYCHLIDFSSNNVNRDRRKILKMRWHNLWIKTFIAPRNLKAYATYVIPEHKIISDLWIHNCNIEFKKSHQKQRDIPLIIHAPSHAGIKGTEYFESALNELKKEGLEFEYQKIENLNHNKSREKYQNADIILDQIIMGGFGTLACEGMAYGKVVCSYLIESVKQEFFPDCPIYNVEIDNLKKQLKNLILDKSMRQKLADIGPSFVKKHLDENTLVRRLLNLYSL